MDIKIIKQLVRLMIESDLEDAGVKARCTYAKQTLEVEFDEKMISENNTGHLLGFLNIFCGDFYSEKLPACTQQPEVDPCALHEIKLDDAARFFVLMCKLFDKTCVKTIIMQRIPKDKFDEMTRNAKTPHSTTASTQPNAGDLLALAGGLYLMERHVRDNDCSVQ